MPDAIEENEKNKDAVIGEEAEEASKNNVDLVEEKKNSDTEKETVKEESLELNKETNKETDEIESGGIKEVKEEELKPKEVVEKKGLWGLLHIYSSQNNTILHVTDMSGAETICIKYGGQMVKADKDKPSPYAAMKSVGKIAEILRDKGITGLDVNVRAPGGHQGPVYPGKGAQAAIKQLARVGITLGKIVDTTPIAHGGCRPKKRRRV